MAARRVVAFVPDLMDRSKLAGRAEFVASVDELAEAVVSAASAASGVEVVVVVDLSRPGVLEALPGLAVGGTRVVGFGSHVDTELLAAARAAGCEVMPRSKFFAALPDLLA